jgi:serine/threonine-protein kinase
MQPQPRGPVESRSQASGSYAMVQPGRMLGPYGTALVDSSGRPIQGFPVQPGRSHDVPSIVDESSTGPSSADVQTQVYRPRSPNAVALPSELPSSARAPAPTPMPPPPEAEPTAEDQPGDARSYLLGAAILVIVVAGAVAVLTALDIIPPLWR